jgi:hypothetical protein
MTILTYLGNSVLHIWQILPTAVEYIITGGNG